MSIRERVRSEGVFNRLHRYPSRGWIAGVCAGLAEYFDWNAKLLRVLFVLAFVFGGFFPAGLVYCVLWYLMEDGSKLGAGGGSAGSGTAYRDAAREETWRGASASRGSSMGDVRSRFDRMEARLRSMEECVSSQEFELRRELRKLET